jgi:hypothetical protein
MKIRPRSLPRPVLLLAAVGAIVGLVLAAVGSAGATPATSPPITTLIPGEGAPVAATAEPIAFSFNCPSFATEEGEPIEEEIENEEEELETIEVPGPPVLGNSENYAVHFSTSPAVSSFGMLGVTGFGEAGEGEAELVKGTADQCSSELEIPNTPLPAVLRQGKVYWQVYRESAFGDGGFEVGPVRSFNLYPDIEEPEMTFREQVFTGYLTKVGFGYEANLEGAVVQLQEWEGSAWHTLAEAPGSKEGENTFFIKLSKPGRHLFRPLIIGGTVPLGLEPTAKVVRKPTKQRVTTAADDGSYIAANKKEAEESPLGFTVGGGGKTLKSLKLEVETTCAGPTKAQNVTIEIPATLSHAKIAPDGTVFGVSTTKGPEVWTTTLTGSLFQGRFQGELSTAHANCTGYRTIDAVLKPPTKK